MLCYENLLPGHISKCWVLDVQHDVELLALSCIEDQPLCLKTECMKDVTKSIHDQTQHHSLEFLNDQKYVSPEHLSLGSLRHFRQNVKAQIVVLPWITYILAPANSFKMSWRCTCMTMAEFISLKYRCRWEFESYQASFFDCVSASQDYCVNAWHMLIYWTTEKRKHSTLLVRPVSSLFEFQDPVVLPHLLLDTFQVSLLHTAVSERTEFWKTQADWQHSHGWHMTGGDR